MTSESLKIICVEQGNEVSRIIRTVYGSLRYMLETLCPQEDYSALLKKRGAHLLVLDLRVVTISASEIKHILRTNPPLYIVLIGSGQELLDEIPHAHYVKQVDDEHLAQKLPLLLSEIYNAFSEDIYSGLGFRKLLKESLYRMTGIILIARQDGYLIFANQAAERLLGVGDGVVLPQNITDIMADGKRSWKYVTDTCCDKDNVVNSFLLKFFNHLHEEVAKTVEVQVVYSESPYFLLREKLVIQAQAAQQKNTELQLLDKFAEAVANELLNPVNVLAGRMQLLTGTLEKEKLELKNAQAINRQVARIEEIVGKLLTFARLKQDYIPQRISFNELLKTVKLEPSIQRLLQGSDIELQIEESKDRAEINGQIAQFDLLLKTLLEISFLALGSKGSVTLSAGSADTEVFIHIRLHHNHELFEDMLSLHAYLDAGLEHNAHKSIETTIVLQVIQQYEGTIGLSRPTPDAEYLRITFPLIQSIN